MLLRTILAKTFINRGKRYVLKAHVDKTDFQLLVDVTTDYITYLVLGLGKGWLGMEILRNFAISGKKIYVCWPPWVVFDLGPD